VRSLYHALRALQVLSENSIVSSSDYSIKALSGRELLEFLLLRQEAQLTYPSHDQEQHHQLNQP
jgi:hypothetical protein